MSDIAAMSDASLLIITDEKEERQISIVCNSVIRHEIAIRRGKFVGSEEGRRKATDYLQYSLPETLSALIKYMTDIQLCVVIVGVFDGQYRAVIEDVNTGTAIPIRVSDGALLTYADTHIPLYIEESLWQRQSIKYGGENAPGIAMPLNTLSMPMLQSALNKCIDEEQYEMAQRLKEEIERRTK